MESLEWYPVFYNGLETNVEVTKCGRVRRIKVDWMKNNKTPGEVDFSKIKIHKGYRILSVKVKNYKFISIRLHQLMAAAFLNHKFNGMKNIVDHIDFNTLNNNIENLRVISQRENCSRLKTLKSGLPVGVNKRGEKYYAQIAVNKKLIGLGTFSTIEEASNAYQQKLKSLT